MYVNMHELANLAASRAQEMQLPLPPPPASLSAPGTEKVRILIYKEYDMRFDDYIQTYL